jgi:hypothetical protein
MSEMERKRKKVRRNEKNEMGERARQGMKKEEM